MNIYTNQYHKIINISMFIFLFWFLVYKNNFIETSETNGLILVDALFEKNGNLNHALLIWKDYIN
jgi:hypothetical protein